MSTDRQARHQRIRALLRAARIGTHQALAQALARHGIVVSQSTLSKDLRELGVVRVPQPEGGFRYALSEATEPGPSVYERGLRDGVTGVDRADNLTVIKTLPGHAQAVCEALDRMAWPEVMATLAGENTIFAVSRTAGEAQRVCHRLAELSGAGTPTQ